MPLTHSDQDSNFIAHEPCPSCNSKDNLARYDDGHAYCFGCGHYESAEGEVTNNLKNKALLQKYLSKVKKDP